MNVFHRARLWFKTQAELEASLNDAQNEVRRLERALTVAADRHDADMASLRAMHRTEVARWTRDVNHKDTQIGALTRACEEAERRVREERRLSDAAWQRVALLGALADDPDMPAHLAERIRTVGERVQRIKEAVK